MAKGHRYLTLVGDHRQGAVVWGTEGKGQAAADEFFDVLDPPPAESPALAAPSSSEPVAAIMVPFGPCPTVPAGEGIPGAWLGPGSELDPRLFARASRLTAVSMDMTGGYAKSVREHAPQATIVIDNYHVVALATRALDEVRREHWNELRSAGQSEPAKAFKDARWSLLKNPEDLTDRQAATLAAFHAAGGKVPRAWTMKEMVRAIFAPRLSVAAVEKLIDRLLARLCRSRLEPFVRLGRTIRKHREGILAARRLNLSNARAEALNNKVKLIVRRAYGFHSARAVFPPQEVAEVKAIACELPATRGLPLSKFSRVELHRLVIERGVTDASASTIWRWLHEDAIKPWQTRSWIFPRDPDFAAKAGRVLDLYDRVFEGKRLRPDEYVICADEKSQLQALGRRHATVPAGPGRPGLVEFEYRRGGTLAYLAAWDVHHANLFDRVEEKTGIVPFARLVEEVMNTEPYKSARRVFWIVDNGSSHCGKASITRMHEQHPCARLIHLPVHASWLNQIELYFSIVQRKALTPNDFPTLQTLTDRLLAFAEHYRQIARPFEWTFTRQDLNKVLARIADREPHLRLAA